MTDEQKQIISGRFAKVGFIFALRAWDEYEEADAKRQMDKAKRLEKILSEGRYKNMSIYTYNALNALLDSVNANHIKVPQNIVDVIESILEIGEVL